MIARVVTLTQQLILDYRLSGYWLSRGLIASVYFLFGILLREAGYGNFDVVVAWILVYITQSVLLMSLDYINKRFDGRYQVHAIMVPAALSWVGLFTMTGNTLSVVAFSASAILMLPLIRETVHNGTLYIRDSQHWTMGKNLASLYANEMGKGFGAFFIFIIGYISNINPGYVATFILALLLVSAADYLLARHRESTPRYTGSAEIGPAGTGYVRITAFHNACFTSIKAILTLVVFDILNETRDLSSVITTLASVVSVMMFVGMIALQIFKDRLVEFLRRLYRTHFITHAIGLITAISIGITVTVYSFALGLIDPKVTGYLISIGISLLMAFGGLFTLGTLQYLDDVFCDPEDPERDDRRKTTLHKAWVSSSFSPTIILGLYCLGTLWLDSITNALIILSLICVIEVATTAYSYRLSRSYTSISK